MRLRRLLQRLGRPVSCVVARESASARLDGEPPGVSTRRLRQHLADCPPCARFVAGCETLRDHLSALSPPPLHLAPEHGQDGAADRVLSVIASCPPAAVLDPRSPSIVEPLRKRRRWLVPLVPASLLAAGLPLGAFATFHAPPKHPALCHVQQAPPRGPELTVSR